MYFIIFIVFVIVLLASLSIRIIPEYERAVVLRLGRVLPNVKGPGIFFLIPIIDKAVIISIRIVTLDIEPQDIITKDNISLKVNAVLYFRVVNPIHAYVNIDNYLYATTQLAQTHLRSILGEHTLDDLLTNREKINLKLQEILDQNTDPWGVKITAVEVKHVDLPEEMRRAMAIEAEAERERRAKIIAAEGELQAAQKLKEAADTIAQNDITIQLRYLQTLTQISSEPNKSFWVVPIPIDLLKSFMNKK